MSGSNKNLEYFLNSLWDESRTAFYAPVDHDGVGRSYAMLSNPGATRIGCAIGNCYYGFCAVDVYTAYNFGNRGDI